MRTRTSRTSIGPLAGALALVVAALSMTAPVSAAAAPWRIQATFGPSGSGQVSCAPGTSDCTAGEGGELLSSTNAGATWTVQTSDLPLGPTGVGAIDEPSCPAATMCQVVGATVQGRAMALSLKSATTKVEKVPTGLSGLTSVSCSSISDCVATDDSELLYTTNGGTSWSAGSLPQSPPAGTSAWFLPSVGCAPSGASCWAVGNDDGVGEIAVSTNDGKTWSAQTPPPSASAFSAIACPSSSECLAVGTVSGDALVAATTDGGTKWTAQTLPVTSSQLRDVSCATTRVCWLAGFGTTANPFAPLVLNTTDAGAKWTIQTLPAVQTGGPLGISCPTTTKCSAVSGGEGLYTTNGGGKWSAVPLPTGLGVSGVGDLSCPTTSACFAALSGEVGSNHSGTGQIVSTTDGGAQWVSRTLPTGTPRIADLSCPSASDCVVVASGSGKIPSLLYTTTGGMTWKTATLPVDAGSPNYVSCGTATTCTATTFNTKTFDAVFLQSTDGGANWVGKAAPTGIADVFNLSCTSAKTCFVSAVNASFVPMFLATSNGGSTWTTNTLPAGVTGGVSDLSCVGTSDCWITGEASSSSLLAVVATTNAGKTWKTQTVPANLSQTSSTISCSSTTVCSLVTSSGQSSTPEVLTTSNSGATWTTQTLPSSLEIPADISCVGSECWALAESFVSTPLVLTTHP